MKRKLLSFLVTTTMIVSALGCLSASAGSASKSCSCGTARLNVNYADATAYTFGTTTNTLSAYLKYYVRKWNGNYVTYTKYASDYSNEVYAYAEDTIETSNLSSYATGQHYAGGVYMYTYAASDYNYYI